MTNKVAGTALVTGASSGIGAIYADRLAHRGYDLVLVARDEARMEVLPADLSVPSNVATVAQRLASDAAITMLVNNAGVSLNGGLLENGPAELSQLIAINITATTLLANAAGKAFVQRGGGTIVNIASVLAVAPELIDGVYSGSKAYLLNLSLGLAAKVGKAGVHVQAVLPGATRTEIWARSGKDPDALLPGMVMEADDLVDAALAGLDKGETVTIPPLADEGLWATYETARLALAPHLSRREVAQRYRQKLAA
jgi:uncharacterized protein